MRFGIIGTGFIANQFAADLKFVKGAELRAVSSRSLENAKIFANKYGLKKYYASVQEMLLDPSIDVIYIATPNHCHAPDSIAALNAGKAVICEKPFALNSTQLQSIIAVAKEKNLFLMEALWTQFLPSFCKFIELANNGAIGDCVLFRADFGFNSPFNPQSRLYDSKQGGGSVYDIGIYPLFAAYRLFGEPLELQTIKVNAPSGVDKTALIQMRHKNDKVSMLASSFDVDLDCEANLYGTKGKLTLKKCFHIPTTLTLENAKGTQTFEFPKIGNGYQYEASAAIDAMQSGLKECPAWNLNQSITLMQMIDKVLGNVSG